MEIHNKSCKESLEQFEYYIKNKDYDAALRKMSYLTGLYGVFYGIALLYRLSEDEQLGFIEALKNRCDPDPQEVAARKEEGRIVSKNI